MHLQCRLFQFGADDILLITLQTYIPYILPHHLTVEQKKCYKSVSRSTTVLIIIIFIHLCVFVYMHMTNEQFAQQEPFRISHSIVYSGMK